VNVLLTCAGRRNYLVEYFKKSLNGQGRVLAADQSKSAPALQEADASFVLPNVYAPDYIDRLLSLCRREQVRLVIPLNDLELPVLAENKNRFLDEGTIIAVSDPDVVATCFDKCQTLRFAQEHGITMPPTYLSPGDALQALNAGALMFPLIVKPRWGSASFGVEVCCDGDELDHVYALTKARLARSFAARFTPDIEKSILIQAKISGPEFGLDIVNDLSGRYVCTFVKQKLSMHAGETDKAVSVDHPVLSQLGELIGRRLGHIANLDVDICTDGKVCFLIDMNPRFGGGYPFSQMAGANLPAALMAWAQGKTPDPSWLQIAPGVGAAKCHRLVEVV
jgi:carbamoyl-phosphate synthase large subunit